MHFFRGGWPDGRGGASSPAAPASEAARACDPLDPVPRLARVCKAPGAHAFLRPLAGSLSVLAEALSRRPACASKDLRVELAAAAELLERGVIPARHLDFALAVHTNEASTGRFLAGMDRALRHLTKEGLADQAVVPRWREEARIFSSSCEEVWKLHTYLVFLDTRGDRALFDQAARQLCKLLGCPARSLATCLEHTRPWVDDVLRALANRELEDLFKSLHAGALQQWQVSWRERTEQLPEKQRLADEHHGTKFWESYFTHLFKITWPDFVEAFEHFYLLGRIPVDVMNELRLQVVDPAVGGHQVSRSAWQNLVGRHSRSWDLVDTLLADVLGDVGARIYRPSTLRSLVRPRPRPAESEDAALEEPSDPSSSSTAPAAPAPPAAPPPPQASAVPATRPKPWFLHHSADNDGDMAIPTPHDLRIRQGTTGSPGSSTATTGEQQTMTWDAFVARLCAQSRPWWGAHEEASLEDTSEEPLRIAALRAVCSSVAYTRRALIFRVVSGDLSQSMPILEAPSPHNVGPGPGPAWPSSQADFKPSRLPALVVTANGNRFGGVTKFGRTSSRRTLLPDCPMSEPIASRSHFNVIYDQDSDRYYLMDAGSKWGTFVKLRAGMTLSCGDWIRVGGVEFIIRYCGGGCRKSHAHYRLHSLRLLRDHQGWSGFSPGAAGLGKGLAPPPREEPPGFRPPRTSWSTGDMPGFGCADADAAPSRLKQVRSLPNLSSESPGDAGRGEGDSESEDDGDLKLQDELLLLLSSGRPRGWTAASARLCQQAATPGAGTPDAPAASSDVALARPSAAPAALAPMSAETDAATKGSNRDGRGPVRRPRWTRSVASAMHSAASTHVPIAPLELDFISGPRMGEKLVLNERVCTLGRGEGNTIQVSDSQLASVSRVHCVFEYVGDRWHMRDNNSTNGTWRRLSCVLEPSAPVLLQDGTSIQAGVHEFFVEEAEMRHWWAPSSALASIEELHEQERRSDRRPPPPPLDPGGGSGVAGVSSPGH